MKPAADICLLLEGTFPYVSGGVSSWVNQVIRGFPEYTFSLAFLGGRPEDYGKRKYELPPNVVHIEEHYMHARHAAPPVITMDGNRAAFETSERLHDAMRAAPGSGADFSKLAELLEPGHGVDETQFLYSRASWDVIAANYRARCTDPSFVDYFWTVRVMHQPIWVLVAASRSLPPARCYHTISTGYAGFLGALLRRKTGRPLILSEHGIYTKERKIDLFQSEWIRDNRDIFQRDPTDVSYLRQLWISFYESLGRVCYDAADFITALYEVNRQRQIRDGADPARTRNIPNGIDIAKYAAARAARPERPPHVLCLIGRVVPIKDIKTFIRAMRTVANSLPDAEGWIAGPEDEDPAYAQECRNLAESLGLSDKVKFLGFQKVDELLPRVGLVVLSSISEAFPLVLLEGFAAGVPAVTTDVGACRDIIYGQGEEDAALGAAGRVVRIADPQALGESAVELLGEATWHAASQAAIRRVETYYTQERMFGMIREVYEEALLR